MKLRRLPVGDSSFESIRANDCVYVDKTRHLFQMADEGKFYFLSRPRRFGKSLTVSVLRCLFQGKKDLFDGLWIADNTEWEWKAHPVLVLDFNGISHDTPENLKLSLQRTFQQIAGDYEVSSDAPLLENQFKELILSLYRKTGMPVVILIDEYDKPLIAHLGKGEKALEIAKANRDILKYLFGVIKDGDVSPALRLVFITGVSKFSRVSMFSELNNLKDLTMNRHYANMLGYTQSEIETEFTGYIGRFAEDCDQTREQILEKMKSLYDGYRFSEKNVRVYNPFSLLKSLDEMAFKNYWFETGTPTFLVNILNETNWYLPKIENLQATEAVFSTYELENLKPEALLFQTGYITIKEVSDRLYTFDYPNQEVKTSFLEILFHSCTKGLRDGSRFVLLNGCLYQENYEQFFETVSSIFSSIPYTLESRRDEAYFHTVFYLMLCASGVNARSEILTCNGRIDLVVEFPDKIFIIEFKCDQSAEAGIAQIRNKRYDKPFRQGGKKIILLGINFDSEKRNVAEWKVDL